MTKNTFLIFLLPVTLIIVWLAYIITLLGYHEPYRLLLAVITTVITVGAMIYLQYTILLTKRMQNIEKLANEIDNRVLNSLEPIDELTAPKEIRPIIKALNRLLAFEEDKYNQERDFTSNASHELRTPLAGIRLQTQIAMLTKDKKQRDKAHKNIIKAIDRGTHLVEQLLTLSRLTADSVSLAMDAVNLEKVIAAIIAELSYMTKEKKISLRLLKGQKRNDNIIYANLETTTILIHNLIRNAIIYTRKEGKVRVKLISENGHILLVVSDNGPGINPQQRDIVMKRFKKSDTGTNTGTGLGLAIVKRIADLHDTNVDLSEDEDLGGLKVSIKFRKA